MVVIASELAVGDQLLSARVWVLILQDVFDVHESVNVAAEQNDRILAEAEHAEVNDRLKRLADLGEHSNNKLLEDRFALRIRDAHSPCVLRENAVDRSGDFVVQL